MQPNRFGLYRAHVPNDETLYVADVEPGEKTLLRVAILVGFTGYGREKSQPLLDFGRDLFRLLNFLTVF